jgi:hypothetical protein
MRKNPRRILSPQRLPFRHPGIGITNLTNRKTLCNTADSPTAWRKTLLFFAYGERAVWILLLPGRANASS